MITADNNLHSSEHNMVSEWHHYALEQTIKAMTESSIAQPHEIEVIRKNTLNNWNNGLPAEPLYELTALQEPDSSQLDAIVEHNAQMISSTFFPNILPAPFAKQMPTPSSFYEKHEAVYEMAKSFKCPILYNEDADVIGLASINPVTVVVFGQAIQAYISETLSIQPFISKVRINYATWTHLCEKHFLR